MILLLKNFWFLNLKKHIKIDIIVLAGVKVKWSINLIKSIVNECELLFFYYFLLFFYYLFSYYFHLVYFILLICVIIVYEQTS